MTVDSAPSVPRVLFWCMSCCRMRSKLPLITHLRLAPKICLVESQKYSPLCVICRLLVFAEWIRGTQRGRDSKWITLPLNKQGKKKKGGRMSASGNHKTEQGRPVFSILFWNSLIHAATPPPFWFIQGGFNLHSGPITRFANQFLSPLCGPLSVLF